MSNIKKMIILLSIVVIIIIVILLIVLNVANKKDPSINEFDPTIEDSQLFKFKTKLERVSVKNNYYVVNTIVNKFYTYYMSLYTTNSDNLIIDEEAEVSIKKDQEEKLNAIYQMLDNEYIQEQKITKDDLSSKLSKINEVIVNVTDMYVSQKNTNTYAYFVYGNIRDKKTGTIKDFSMIVKVDMLNRTYTLLLEDYMNIKYKDLKIGEEVDISVPESIEKNEYNTFTYTNITEETYVTDLFNNYKNNILYNSKKAYENLDKEYKTKRFGSLEKFQEYVKNNTRKNVTMKLNKYQKTSKNDYTQYTCIDQNGNYYIFKEIATMQYSLILDTYTIDLPEFLERYNNAKEEEKVLYNIQKVFEAINSQDYTYVYNKLDNTFKANYFKTQAEFEKYIKTNFYTNNEVSYGKYEKSQDVYIYNIMIKDKNNTTANAINKKFVMQLKEGTDFVMSFNVT